ncbi:MAG TPA: threonine/serine dehydratase [Gemmatimonadaceae bacterium]|nr:threonine/serine dehydratase [Gemmatimonadaceae bacterium]
MTATSFDLVSAADVDAAARVLADVAVHTPLLPAPWLGDNIWLKPEMLQRGGAFKLRGAYNFLRHLDPAARARGVVAPSSGNHAQAVALAARLLGAPAIVVMPTTVTAAKRAGAERLGARVELAGTTTADRMERALQIARDEGATLVPPYDDPLIIAGQGTVGLEIVQDMPDVAAVLVPVGGGGLSAGVAAAVKLHKKSVRVIGVEPTGAPKLSRARQSGAPVKLDRTQSIADGLLAVEIGHLTFAHHQRFVDEVVLVDDGAMRDAMRALLDRGKLVAEPSGAITVAAMMQGLVKAAGPTVLVLSGGNIEWDGLTASMG